jgi:2-polyprenyl-3-methyl-5-hydroxy-6-metoxy-1,4-benzoquinol methylase
VCEVVLEAPALVVAPAAVTAGGERTGGIMFRARGVVIGFVVLACLAALGAQAPRDDESVWNTFMGWFKAAPPSDGNPLGDYAASLRAARVSQEEITRQVTVLTRMLMRERSDWVEPYYDRIFTRPLTGDPATDRFTTAPSAFLVEAAKDLAPGMALDAGMGQGRNAVYLAGKGWRVTGFDLSAEAVKAAAVNAGKAGVRIDAIKASHAEFDFGTAKWNLVVMTFAWAPVTDPAFVARLRASLRPNGRIVFEHLLEVPGAPRPALMYALRPGQLREVLAGFRLERYEEFRGLGDWSGPDSLIVRTVAVKQ